MENFRTRREMENSDRLVGLTERLVGLTEKLVGLTVFLVVLTVFLVIVGISQADFFWNEETDWKSPPTEIIYGECPPGMSDSLRDTLWYADP